MNQFLQEHHIELFVDIHGLSSKRESVVDICTNNNINTNGSTVYVQYLKEIIGKSFGDNSASVDKYFSAASSCVLSAWINHTYGIPAVELEINGAYRWFEGDCTNQSKVLFNCIAQWLREMRDGLETRHSPKTVMSPCDGCRYEEECALCDGEPECQLSYNGRSYV